MEAETPESMKVAAFFTKVLELTTPAITKRGSSDLKKLSALLAKQLNSVSLLQTQPKLKALLEPSR
jgi:hypothetical protein